MKILVLGAGAWGSAVAMGAAQHPAGHAVTLWARDAAQLAAMQAGRENARYLPGMAFPPVHLAEINFQAMFEQQQAAAAGQPTPITTQ